MPEKGVQPYARPPNATRGEAPGVETTHLGGYGVFVNPQTPDSTDPLNDQHISVTAFGGSPSTALSDIRLGTREEPNNPDDRRGNWWRRWAEKLNRHLSRESVDKRAPVQQSRIPAPTHPLWEQERPAIRGRASDPQMDYPRFTREWYRPRPIWEDDPTQIDAAGRPQHPNVTAERDIWGMKPQGDVGANLFRVAPRPWDEQLYVAPGAGETMHDYEAVFENRGWSGWLKD